MPGGALDPAFGEEGVVTTPVGDELTSLVRQPDGRIVAAGSSRDGFVLVRYEVDGSLDPTFGDEGIVRTTFSFGRHGASAVTIQADGRLVATGRTGTAECMFALARYEPDGSLDPTFGSGGMVTTDLGPACERASEVRVQPDGRIVAAGGGGDAIQTAIAVARYLPNGSLDPSFGDGGIVLEDVSPAEDWAFGLAIQQDGGILAAGTGSFPSDWILLRLLG
jgi:uncharacterized delta-60 repeat protein